MAGNSFAVERVILCDYASMDIAGKAFAVGIVSPEIYVPPGIRHSIPFFILLTLVPLSNAFQATLDVRSPKGKSFFKANLLYQKQTKPLDSERCNFILQLPTVEFQGYGRYILSISGDGAAHGSFFLDVKEGLFASQDVGQIAVQVLTPPQTAY